MNRLIDADKLDEEAMHLFIAITGNPKQSTVVNECKKTFRNMIDEQPTADIPDTNVGEWIPITEKLPDPLNCCLVTLEAEGELVVDIAYRYEDKFFYPEDGFGEKDKGFTIIAWIHLPGPYKPEGGSH